MKAAHWQALLAQAVQQGLLPEEAARPETAPSRPWPVVLLSFFGALMAAVPLTGFVALLFGELLLREEEAALALGLVLLSGAAVLLHQLRALFGQHLALVLLLLGMSLSIWGLLDLLPERSGLLLATALVLALAPWLPTAWVRALLGASAAALAWWALRPHDLFRRDPGLTAGGALLLAWAAALALQHALLFGADTPAPQGLRHRLQAAARLDAVLGGWLLASVALIAASTGMTMFAGASLPSTGLFLAGRHAALLPLLAPALLLAMLAGLAPRWPLLRTPVALALLLVVAVLSYFMPALALVGAAGLLAARTHRPLQAACAALAGAWIIGSFYYSLRWPLATKALVLAAAGLALGLFLLLRRGTGRAEAGALPPRRAGWVALGLLATLAVVNAGIWQKETLIATGRPVYVELAPVDPRSLMQGDYMALNYQLGPALQQALQALPPTARPQAVARVDARGVARLERLAQGALAPDELLVALKPMHGRWVVASDAWFFAEGEGRRYEAARYGEFRIAPDGQALLVGLADAELRRLEAPAR